MEWGVQGEEGEEGKGEEGRGRERSGEGRGVGRGEERGGKGSEEEGRGGEAHIHSQLKAAKPPKVCGCFYLEK